MCVSPYIATDKQGNKIPVPCGHCIECYQKYQDDWTFRLCQEMKRTICPVFVTLTYNDRNLPLGDSAEGVQSVLVKRDLQLFLKRLRKNGKGLCDGLRYFAVGEYGFKYNRCHFHLVMVMPNLHFVKDIKPLIEKCWQKGFIKVRFCKHEQIKYVCKYVNKIDRRKHLVAPFRMMSRSIGLNYLTDKVIEYYLQSFSSACKYRGFTMPLPRYYRKKLDEYSANNYFLKRAGLTYSDLLYHPKAPEGSKAYYMQYFKENYKDLFDKANKAAIKESLRHNSPYFEPTAQEVWKIYQDSIPMLKELFEKSKKLLDEMSIKGRIRLKDTGQAISPEGLENSPYL